MTLADALAAGHVRVIPGTRVDVDEFGDDGLGVVTADDLDDPAAIGTRRVDQLGFAQAHPSAALTRSGDVVFRTSRSPRAWVDHSGSHVVVYPARVLRITPGDPGGLVPELVAADIAAGAAVSSGWRRCQVRVVDPAQVAPLRAVLAAASATREQLQDRIDRLDRMTALLADAVAARAVTLNDAPHR
ncbi:hypothetical protein [Microbacterium elymi]|uniref:Restriction endonuclease subunit S n=1 Tax=Microbacterium elymi TaxID=2909587 RepID=A0ABY5NLL5_9MICO|nr:hypothetical protein [Microbacterium elymi]UUT36009.1 hypothetical protein L2X98_23155 [Microbacterium elymi]